MQKPFIGSGVVMVGHKTTCNQTTYNKKKRESKMQMIGMHQM